MSKKMDILTTLSKGIYKDDNYSVVDKQVVDMINEYYRRFKQDIEFQGRMNITILSLDNLDGDAGEDLRWKKIKEALPDVYDKDFVDFTLINCRNLQEIESSFVDHSNFVYNSYKARTIVISRFEIFKDFAKSKDWRNQAYFIEWYDTKDEWLKSRIKTANYEDNLKIDDSVVTIDFDSLKDKINPYDIQKILNYRETNRRGKITFVISDTKTVQEMYDILGLPYGHYGYIWIMGKGSSIANKQKFKETIKKFNSSFICMNEEFLKKCETKDVYRTVYTITNNGITLVKKPKEMPRLSRPHFGDKSDKIEHKAALSQRWYFLLQENTWRDKNGNRHFVPNMPENYIKNCILWLDETLCGKYIPDPVLRRKFKSLFQNELSHRDTLNRLSLYDLTDLYVNYRKNHENEDLLDKYSRILYSKPFCETAASEKVHIFRSIEIDEKLKKEKRVMKIHKRDDYTTFYLCEDDFIVCRIEPHYENGHLLGGSQYTINPKKDDEAYNNLLKEFENEPYLTNMITEKELLDGKKFQDLHSQMAIKCGIDVNDLPSMEDERPFSQKVVIEKIVNELKAFGTEEVIKHYQNTLPSEKSNYFWEDLEIVTSSTRGSTKIPIKVRMILNAIAHNNYKKTCSDKYSQVAKEVFKKPYEKVILAFEHNYNDLEKNVKKQKAYGTKYQNMSYDELVNQGLWKDANNNIYIISSMRNGHIANILDMLNTNKYSLNMSSETKEKYKKLFAEEFEIRNKLKDSEPQFLSKEEHNEFHTFNKKENDVVNRPAHYANRKYEPINVISDWKLDFLLGNTVKYISRLGLKDDPKQDINKSLFYLIYKCKQLGLTQEEIEKTVKQIFSM